MATEIMLPYDVLRHHRKRVSKPVPKKRMSKETNPSSARRTIQLMGQSSILGPPPANWRSETYAGPAFSVSPSPGELPLPSFNSRRMADDVARLYATMDLRRILRIDQ